MNRYAVAAADHLQPTSVHALQNGPDLMAEQQATRDHLELEGRSDRQPLIQLKHRLFTEPELVNGRSQFEAAVLIRTTQRINLERSNPHTEPSIRARAAGNVSSSSSSTTISAAFREYHR